MAKKVIEKFYSDLSGDEITSKHPTVQFSLDGTSYEIDLTDTERKALQELLSPYTSAARTSGRKAARQRSGPPAAEIRAWAIEQGMDIPNKGRIPFEIQAAYDKTH